jgi:hypothetical protein
MSSAFRRTLPARPDLDQQKKLAKELLRAYRGGDRDAIARMRAELPDKTEIGVSVDLGARPRRPTVLQDLLLDTARGRAYYLMPRRAGEPQIVQGRIDCDSLWGTSRPRYSKQEPSPIVLRRVRTAR